ncbi:biotin-dependent carboxyltransferase family protein [Enterovirga rhinocerotis]|uniref:Biotin-dependent carboxylase-like uncharacterized protein n=1 Tax=Enterovirga rhinocerotis TaxID=1339210 RepID=A0A4R7C945_9HYPH|nr:biotin-dependent carboxyltransferase family protein [Enterovirga rhinocerotis]TDR93237.1 biotin-dependent carboxylase-like uncharacterized protein [Enterovirga rhinocerotis]
MSALLVKTCGPMTSLQDAGRIGAGRSGISRSGAMDGLSLAEANALVGNPPDIGAIELMLVGGTFEIVGGPARIALAGARMALTVDGAPVAPSTSCTAPEGATITIGGASEGIYAYLAVAGGFDVAPQLGSVSLQPRAGIGGLDGRPFRAGDRIPLRSAEDPAGPEHDLPPWRPDADPIRVVLGPQDDLFPPDAVEAFLGNTYTVSEEADRMGYRLAGQPIEHLRGFNIVSDGLVAGSVQVPGSGLPIVMMSDHQTTGGYPKIATVISVDRARLAQRRVGTAVRFAAVPVAEAHAILRAQRAAIAALPSQLRVVHSGLPSVEEMLALNLAGEAKDALAEG